MPNVCGFGVVARYLQLYLYNRQTHTCLFKTVYDRLGETASFSPKQDIGRRRVLTAEEDLLVPVTENSKASERRIFAASEIISSFVFRTIHRQKLIPYHFCRSAVIRLSVYSMISL